MKKILLSALVAIGLCVNAYSQAFFEAVTFTGAFAPAGTSYTAKIEGGFTETFATGNWTEGWTNWYPNAEAYSTTYTETLSGDVTADKSISGVVKLEGTVHVKNGATLTIAAGTVIRGGLGGTLIVAKGSKINAVGTKSSPIVFTSAKDAGQRAPGDWAGILLIGNSQTNTLGGKRQYEALPNDPLAEYGGGANPILTDNSGEMRFVRIEFAGYNYLPDQELNGLTLGAVGSGTRVNFVQVSYARDDSFEWFGGTSKHKYLVAYAGIDDDFDMDEGYAGYAQFILGVRNPTVYETAAGGTSNGFEHDNNTGLGSAAAVVPGVNNPTPNTNPFISNATLIGPWATATVNTQSKFGRGMEMRTGVATSVYNSLVVGYNSLAQLVHPTVSITPSTAWKLKLAKGDNDVPTDITKAEYRNTHLIPVNTASGFAYTTANNQPAPTLNFATYFASQGNSLQPISVATNLFENIISNFSSPTANISYAPKAASFIAGVPADFTNLIADKTAAPDQIASQPSVSISKSSLAFGNKLVGETFPALTFNVTTSNLTGAGVSLTSGNADFTVTFAAGVATVNYTKTTAGASTGSITVNFGDGRISNITVPVSAALITPASPILNVDASTLVFVPIETTTSATYTANNQIIAVSGKYLTADVTVTAPAGYEISTLPTENYGSTLTLSKAANATIATNFYVRLNSNTSGSNAGTITLTSGTQTASVAVSANTNAAITPSATSVNIDYFKDQSPSALTPGFFVNGDRLPLSGVTITSLAPDLLVAIGSANGAYAQSAVLTTTGRIAVSAANVWVKYVGTISGSTAGVQVGTISVTGVAQVIPVNLRLNTVPTYAAAVQRNYILTDASSPVITAIGFTFTGKLRSTPFLYRASDNALIGQVSVLGTNTATLRANALISTNTLYTPITFAGMIDTDISSAEITGTGTAFTDALLPAGLPLHLIDGTWIGYVSTVTSATSLTLQAVAAVTTTTSAFGTSAIYYKRPQATISNSAGSPIAFSISSYTNGIPNPVTVVTTLTGDNHDYPVNVGINPGLTASGYMFELSNGTNTGVFSLVLPVSANGQLNQVVSIKYVPSNITLYSLPALNLNAAHSTELLVLGNNRTLPQGTSSSDPRATLAINLRGNAQAAITVNKTSLAKFSAYTGVASGVQKFNLAGSRIIKDVTVTAPANFQLSTSADFTGATNTLVLPASVTGLTPSLDINVRYLNANVGADNGSISVSTEGIAPLSVAVSGEAVGFVSLVDLSAANGSAVVSFTGITMATISGKYLANALTATASTDFVISETQTGTYTSMLSFSPDPSDFGDVASKVIFVKYTGTTVGFSGTLTAASGSTTETITLINNPVINAVEVAAMTTPKVTVYPNPTETKAATLAVDFAGVEKIEVTVYDLTGSVVSTFFDTVNGLTTYPITGLSSGLYLVKVVSGSTVSTVRLIVK